MCVRVCVCEHVCTHFKVLELSLSSEDKIKVELAMRHAGGTFKIQPNSVCVYVCVCEFITTINHCTRQKEFNYRQRQGNV